MTDLVGIQRQAVLFRSAIEQCAGNLRAISLKKFPAGSCGDVADMLGMFLEETTGICTDYVSGWCGEQSHAWLEYGAAIIDITADQFGGAERVIVSEASALHRGFRVDTRRTPSIGGAQGSHHADLTHDYQLLVSEVRKRNPEADR